MRLHRRGASGADRGDGDQGRLLEYLRGRRWFGEKGAELAGARVADAIPVEWPESSERFVVARVRVDAAKPVFYQLFLHEELDDFADALESEDFRRGLVNAFAAGCTVEHRGVRWVIQSESDAPFKVPADAEIRLSRAEQSNSSVIIGTQAILKLFRRVAPGVHPDLEVTRFLTVERRFLHTPALLGTIHFADAEGTWAAGMLQELVPGATDGWSYALGCAQDWFARGDAVPPPFVADAERLGAITRDLHEVLASGDPGSAFARADAGPPDVAAWTEATVAMMRRALRTARRDGDAPQYETGIRAIASQLGGDAGARIRIHGDYHLGQVLRSVTNAFLVVDFEGEPARPLDERRAPHSPLKDVAGMLRSFAYLAAVASAQTSGDEADARRLAWENALREAFLRGYFAGSQRPAGDAAAAERRQARAVLPASRENADRLIALFEIEKAFYELQYELDNRPDWAWIPLQAIDRLARSTSRVPPGAR